MLKAMVFIDANNWYHNLKNSYIPSEVDITEILKCISKLNNFEIIEVRWYASMPDQEEDREIYRKQRSFLSHLENKGIKVITRKLQRLSNNQKKEKGIDVWIATDMINSALIEKKCELCVLVSGDADFVPTLELISKNNKGVIAIMTKKGFSYELMQKFPYFIIRKELLDKCLRSKNAL